MRSRRRGAGAGAALIGLGGLAALAACSDPQSFIVVTVESAKPQAIDGVSDLVVTVTNGGSVTTLTYPAVATTPFSITGTADPVTGKTGKTLAVSFSSGRSDNVVLDVVARDATRCVIGIGETKTPIKRNGVATAVVALTAVACHPGDGAANPDEGVTFAGCNPTNPATCGAAMTCAVSCTTQMGECIESGPGTMGSSCAYNNDCAPGLQCFLYGGAGTVGCGADGGMQGVCLKFCNGDADCGGGSLCKGAVPCTVGSATVLTSYHTCTFGCDPRGAATQGCPAGLSCFVVDTMDQVDCSCPETTRTQKEGQPCDHAQRLDCAPGLICNSMGGTLRCRKVCKRSDNGADCSAGQTCEVLTNDQIYGACL